MIMPNKFILKYISLIFTTVALLLIMIGEPFWDQTLILSNMIISINSIVIIFLLLAVTLLKSKDFVTIFLTTNNRNLNYFTGILIYVLVDVLITVVVLQKGYLDIVMGLIIIVIEILILGQYLIMAYCIKNFEINALHMTFKKLIFFILIASLYMSEAIFEPRGISISIIFVLMYIFYIGYFSNLQYVLLRNEV